MSQLHIQPASSAVGAEILDVDVTDLSDQDFETMRKAHHEHGLIFVRDQKLTPEQHIAFAERWGEININRFFGAVDGYPQIAEVRKEPDQKINIGGGWHTDHSYDLEPAMGSILYAKDVPATGGDTLFASMCGIRHALGGAQGNLGGNAGGAFQPTRVRRGRGGEQSDGGANRQPGGRHPGRRAPGRDSASGERTQGSVCESRVHDPLRWLVG